MARRRISIKPSWAEPEAPPVRSTRLPPSPRAKLLALAGIVWFWLMFFGWLRFPPEQALELGFVGFVLCQVPLWLAWLGASRRRDGEEE
ncbi:hypothetical protein [Chitinimonas lacunae]|uniref:DUF3329 domain-containing protein n=1 Tax=Chitinimonas lacunae TaxID=1963018 RepID=A0ABV8MVX9_9NEIS